MQNGVRKCRSRGINGRKANLIVPKNLDCGEFSFVEFSCEPSVQNHVANITKQNHVQPLLIFEMPTHKALKEYDKMI